MRALPFIATNRRTASATLGVILVSTILLFQSLPLYAATFTVNSTLDGNDANPGNGVCATSSGECTLRAAIQEANALAGADTISLPAGTYEIQLSGPNVDTDNFGDFDIHTPITINGAGATASIVDGGVPLAGAPPTAVGIDRLFEIHPTAGNVTFKDVTLREGFTMGDGAAIQNWSSGLLKLENVRVLKNLAGGTGGGVNNENPANYLWATLPAVMPKSGRVEIINSTFSGNAAAIGAAINNVATGAIAISANSQFVDNPGPMITDPLDPTRIIPAPGVYDPTGGALANQAEFGAVGSITILDSTIARNYATADGAGVYNAGFGSLLIERSTLADNTTEAEGGGLYANGGAVTINHSTIAGNHAHDGAGIYSGGATSTVGLRSRVTIANTTIAANAAIASGGGVANGGDAQLVLTDVTLTGNKAGDAGAGLENSGFASVDATRVTFTGNIANGEGGGAWIGSTRLSTIRDSLFLNNQAGAPTPDDLANPAGANIAGGGGLFTETGPVTILNSTFDGNTATAEGGGLSLHNFGDVIMRDSVVRNNRADTEGGGVENSAGRVTFERLLVENNYAGGDGGGLHNSSSGPFTIVDTTVQLNSALNGGGLGNAPDNALVVRRSLFFRNTARYPGLGDGGELVEGGYGGGIYSLADGDALLEDSTISGNTAGVGGGGLFHDADGDVRLINLTIWRNSAPQGGGVGVAEPGFVPTTPPQPSPSVIVRNTIIGGSLQGGTCDWYLITEGGNIDTGNTCFLSTASTTDGRDWRSPGFTVDAIADNGGLTLSHALSEGSIAIDSAIGTCSATDQRGVARPQNARCDIGAYEYEGAPPPPDTVAPDTEYLTGPVQDSLTTVAFTFTGTDNLTPAEELQFECRLLLTDLAEPPEPVAPWAPIPPELQWVGCSSPWQAPLLEEGLFTFEVRAVDRGGNLDLTPDTHIFSGLDTNPPQTIIAEKPPLTTSSRAATFTFTGTDNQTLPQFLTFECRLDTNDPELWLECVNPVMFANLTTGVHTVEVRAVDGADNLDPTPARYTWTVGQPSGAVNCDLANIALTAAADAWVNEVVPSENYLFDTQLRVNSGATGQPAVGQNARTLVRFALPNDAPGCTLEAATLRLYNSSPDADRTLQALPLTATWRESTVTWLTQPGATTTAPATATVDGTPGYQEWDVLAHVQSMITSGVSHGWQIRDALESDPTGTAQSYVSREMIQDPELTTLPLLVLRYAADSAPPPAPPTPATTTTTVYCGQVLTQSTKVANDLTNCPGEGLIIGASNIVLDLNGHVIDGPDYLLNNPTGQEIGFPAAIRNSGNTNVVIRNGTLQQFGYGVQLTPGTTRNVIEDLTISRQALAGIELVDADDGRNGNTLRNNTLIDNKTGVALRSDTRNSVVVNNTIDSSRGEAILLQFAHDNQIERNRINGIPVDPTAGSDKGILLTGATNNVLITNTLQNNGDAGIAVTAGSNDNHFAGNTLYRNGDAGIYVQDSHGNQILNNTSHQQSDAGVALNNANDTVIRDNDLRFNPSGVDATGANHLVLENNDGSHSLQSGFQLGSGISMIIRNNVANSSGGAGIAVEAVALDASGNPIGGALIEGNTANENNASGISVAGGGHTLADNDAHNNAAFGILAGTATSSSNNDGGNNRATGNGEPVQCLGVVCDGGSPVPPSAADTTTPNVVIIDGPGTLSPGTMSGTVSNSVAATFIFTGTDNVYPATVLRFECRLDAPPDPLPEPTPTPDPGPPDPGATPTPTPDPIDPGNWAACVSPQIYHNLAQGPHHFEVRVRDLAEPPNIDATPATYNWTIDITSGGGGSATDTTAPTTRINTAPADPSISTAATFYFAGSDNLTPGLDLTFECQLDGGGFTACTSPQTYTGLPAGARTFAVRAKDSATPTNNVDASPATHTWTIIVPPADTTSPDTALGSPKPDAVTALTSATFTFTSTEANSTFACSIDAGATYSACTSPKTYTGLAVGARDFRVRAIDAAGNVDATPATFTWTITTAPILTTVACGQVLTQSTLVNNDLVNCPWDGLVVGANNITIDLNGHTIDGVGLAAGIRNDTFDNVTIKNGISAGFDYGVMLNSGATGNIVENMTVQSNQEAGMGLGAPPHQNSVSQPAPAPLPSSYQSGVSGNILRNNLILSNDQGVWITNRANGNVVINNVLAANAKEGVYLERADNNRVENNDISGSSNGAVVLHGANNNTIRNNILAESGAGVFLGATISGVVGQPSTNNVVEGNQISEINGDLLEIAYSSGNQLINNEGHAANGNGINLYHGNNNLLRGNNVSGNKIGIGLKNSSGNRIEGNNTSESDGDGIALESLSFNNDIVGNLSSFNKSDGIYVSDETTAEMGMLIEGNQTHNNVGYGIYASKVSHTLKDNIANNNNTWGIWVSSGSNGRFNIDGGGNRAQGNKGPLDPATGKLLQCFTIQCAGGLVMQSDSLPPDTLILQAPPNPDINPNATFAFNGSDNGGQITFECQVDGGLYTACVSPATFTLAVGLHNFAVRAVDMVGNVDASPAAYTWTISPPPAGAPETTITAGPDLTTVSTAATFTFVASESGSTFECVLDAGSFAPCTSPKSYTGLPVGPHTFRVRATDLAAETDATPATHAWTIGTAPVARAVACGEVIVQSIRLLNDLLDCTGHGLVVGANGITIDLNGHVIDGTGIDAGILNNGYDSVTVLNGTIHEFEYGVLLNPGAALNVISGLTVELNTIAGIALSDADQGTQGNTIRDNIATANGYGIALYSNTRYALIRGNQLGGNLTGGIHLEFSHDNRVEVNEVATSSGAGIGLQGGNNNTISDNLLTDNFGFGIAVGEELIAANGNRVERNTVSGGQGGIGVFSSNDNQVLYNTVSDTSSAGIVLDIAQNNVVRGNTLRSNQGGIALEGASNNRLEANIASATLGTGIEVGALSYNNVVVQNTASLNAGDGIEVADIAPPGLGNLIDRNTADGNGGDGIFIAAAGHTVAGNRAQLNTGWGIYASAGITDAGGNFAAGNVELAQCFNVVCTLGTVAGTPDTRIDSGPATTSNSRNASFTFTGSDAATPLNLLLFECRLDSTNPLDWVDCEYPQEYLNLTPGEHIFEVRAIDTDLLADPIPARHVWTYVPLPTGVAPEVSIDVAPDAETWQTDLLFVFHANEPDVTFECKVDLFGYEPCGFASVAYMAQGAYEWSLNDIEAGLHTFYVRAIDFEGNVGTPAVYTWRLLGVVTTFTSGPGFTPGATPQDPPTGGPVATNAVTLTFVANVADATFQCSLDLEPFAPCASPVTYTGLLAGAHELRVFATDALSNTELEPAVYDWEIVPVLDVNPPDTSIELAPPNNSSATVFEFTGTDDLTLPTQLTFECRVDSANNLDWEACTSPFNLLTRYIYQETQMAPGQHVFEVRAIDLAEPLDPNAPQAGNIDPSPAAYTWTMTADITLPGTGILSGPAAQTGATNAEFTFVGSDNATPANLLTFECAVDGGVYTACSSPRTVSGLTPGNHLFGVRAIDLAGNVDATPITRTWTIVAASVTTITAGPGGQIVNGQPPATPSTAANAIFVFSSNQAGSTFACSFNGASFIPCTSPRAYTIATNGNYEFAVRATNAQGVLEATPVIYRWAVELGPDITPPNTTITAQPPITDTNTVATFSFTGSDNRTLPANLTFECALDGTAYNSCVSPQQFADLTRAVHVMRIRARDAAGNFDPSSAVYTWTVEPPPVSVILTSPEALTESRVATFTFQSDAPGSTFQCWLDGVLAACTSPQVYTNLTPGEHHFAVLATAPNGTVELAWEEFLWTIGDLSAPITTISSGPALETTVISATFVFGANEPDATFTCALDGSNPLPCTSPQTYAQILPGPHQFVVVAASRPLTDAQGLPVEPLYEPVPVSYDWTIVDNEAPETTIQYGPPTTTASTVAWFGFFSADPTASLECSLDGAAFSGCTSPAEFTDLTPITHTLAVRAVDLAGNVDLTPATHTWRVVQGSLNTPVGTNVTVNLPLPDAPYTATVNFFEVAVQGVTSLSPLTGAPPLPPGYLTTGGQYYDISTTAEWGGPATLCIPYNPATFTGLADRLLHFNGTAWVDVTATNNPNTGGGTGLVCGQPDSLTLFALVAGDGVTPLAAIISGPTSPSSSGTATFDFAADQPGATFQCSLDGLPFTACSSPVTYLQLDNGSHTFSVLAIAADGQIQLVPAFYEWEIILGPDTTPPATTITQGPAAVTTNFISTFEFIGSDDQTAALEMEFICTLDGVTLGTCSSPEEVTVLAGGVHTFTVSAVDLAGNVDPTPAVRSWTVIDLSAPETSIDLGPASEITATSAIFEFSGIDGLTEIPVFDFQCALDNADFTPCTSPYELTGLSVGAHVLRVRAVDLTSVVDPSPELYEWLIIGTVDTTPPDTFIVAGPPVGNSGPDVIFGFTSNEPVASFECALDGGLFETCEPTYELIGLTALTHTLLVRAVDVALNVDASPAAYTWTTTSEPDTFILSGPLTQTNSVNATFVFTTNQTGATFQCSIDGTAFIACTSPYLAGPLIEDTHQFEVRAVNQFLTLEGLQVVDQTPATYEWEVLDITPPDTTILTVTLLGPTDLVEPNSLRFEFSGTDNRTASFELEFECALDTEAFSSCTSPHYLPLAGLAGITHTLQVRAVDALGNVDLSPDSYEFTTAGGEPNTQINSGPAAQTESITATFTFTSTHLAATFECSLDLAAYAACSSPVTFTNIPYGEHQLLVRAIAIDGTVDTTPAEYTWTSGDLTPPTVTITSGPPITTTVITATFAFTSDDAAALFQCSLDGSPLAFCTSGVVYTGLLAGEHTLEVVATKPNLLVEAVPAEWTWTVIDPTAPETTISISPAPVVALGVPAAFIFASNEPGVTFDCALNGATFSQCATPLSNGAQFTGLAVGVQSLLVRAVDASLNVDASPAAYTWTVVGPPLTTILSVPPTTTLTTTATFSFTALSPGGVVSMTYGCSLDGAAFTPCASPVTYTGLTVAAHSFSVRATNSVGLMEAPPVSYNWTVVAAPVAPNTPAGSNVSVTLPLPAITNTVTVTFATVTTAGTTSVTTVSSPPALPAGFLTAGAQYYDISTTAAYVAPVTVCLDYTAGALAEPVRLLHHEGGAWLDITTTNDPVNSVVCGITSSLSPFALATAAPTLDTLITSAPPTQTVSTTANFTFAANDAAATFECTLDAPAAWGSCPATVSFTGLTTTTHTLLVRAKNGAGVVDTTPAGHTWTVLPLPETTILSGPDSPTTSITATFTFNSDQPTATFECALDTAPYTACVSGITYSGLSLGEHDFLVRAKDAVGNVDATPAAYDWQIGDIPPAVTLTSAPLTTTESLDATFVFAAAQAGLNYECALDGAAFAACTSPKSYSGLASGAHTFQVRVFSPTAIVPAPITTHAWTIADLTPPETTITATPVSPISSDLPSSFSFTSNEAGATFECALNGAAFAGCTSPTEYTDLVAGVYTFTVRAFDGSNVDLTPASHIWTVLAPPETIIVSGPPITTSNVVTFTFASDDPAATFECKLDGGPLLACPTPYVLTGLVDGEHTLLVNARNAAGISDLSPEEWTWTVELLPDTMILSGPPITTTSNVATFVLAASEPEVIFECALDGALFAECFTPHSVSGLTVGAHVLQVRTIDASGNIDATPATYNWTVLDGTAPETLIDSGPAPTTTETSATFIFSASEAGSTFACALDGGAFAPCSSPHTVTGLAVSSHTFVVQATDAAGNQDATPAVYEWTVTP